MESSGVPGEGSAFYFTLISSPVPFAPVSPSTSISSPRWLVKTTTIFIVGACSIANEVLFLFFKITISL